MEDVDARSANAPQVVRAVTGDDRHGVEATVAERSNLSLEERAFADTCQAFRPISGDPGETAPASCRKNHGPHTPSETLATGTRQRGVSARALER